MPVDPLVLNPGDLRHNITIQSPSTTRDEAGQENATWTKVLCTRASIQSTSSSAFRFSFQNNVQATNTTHLITIRYPGCNITIQPGMQVLFSDQIYTVSAVDNVLQRNRVVHMACMAEALGSN
jgi:SPP1 family predicted phage head-tail adaptor